MLHWLLSAYDTWRAPALEAERIVYRQDRTALFQLAATAADPNQPVHVRRRNARILRIAIERQALSDGIDRRTRDTVHEQWENLRGSLIR